MKPSVENVGEGLPKSGDNTQGADSATALSAYYARKRSIGFRSLLLLVPVAALTAALASPILGFDLILGGACGIANIWLVMRNNECLLEGRRSRGVYGLMNAMRILGVGVVPVVSAVTGPWWSMGISLAGFFTPLVLYAFALGREYRTG
jgi:hypothetical protein